MASSTTPSSTPPSPSPSVITKKMKELKDHDLVIEGWYHQRPGAHGKEDTHAIAIEERGAGYYYVGSPAKVHVWPVIRNAGTTIADVTLSRNEKAVQCLRLNPGQSASFDCDSDRDKFIVEEEDSSRAMSQGFRIGDEKNGVWAVDAIFKKVEPVQNMTWGWGGDTSFGSGGSWGGGGGGGGGETTRSRGGGGGGGGAPPGSARLESKPKTSFSFGAPGGTSFSFGADPTPVPTEEVAAVIAKSQEKSTTKYIPVGPIRPEDVDPAKTVKLEFRHYIIRQIVHPPRIGTQLPPPPALPTSGLPSVLSALSGSGGGGGGGGGDSAPYGLFTSGRELAR